MQDVDEAPAIQVEVTLDDVQASHFFKITIIDTAGGIPADRHAHILDYFFSTAAAREAKWVDARVIGLCCGAGVMVFQSVHGF